MIANIYGMVSTAYGALMETGTYRLFYDLLVGIAGIYLVVWMIYGSLKVMKGDESLNSLGYNIGKFCVLYLLIVGVLNYNTKPVQGIFDRLTGTVSEGISKIESQIVGGFAASVKTGWDQIYSRLTFSNPPADVSELLAKPEYSLVSSEIAEWSKDPQSWTTIFGPISKGDILEKYAKRLQDARETRRKDALKSLETRSKEYLDNCTGFSPTGFQTLIKPSDYCKPLKEMYDKGRQELEEEYRKDFTKNIEKYNNLKSDLETVIQNSENKKSGAENTYIIGPLIGFLQAILALIVFVVVTIFATAILIKTFFFILEIGLTYVISVCSLIASLPIAAGALLYGKWFKDIFQKWFALSVGNFITIPIVIAALGTFINAFAKLSTSSFGFESPTGTFADMLRVAILGTNNDAFDFSDLFSQIGAIIKLFIVCWLAQKSVDAVKKFLDDLVGNSFNFTSGAGALGQSMGNAVGGVATKAVTAGAMAGVGAAAAVGTAAGGAVGAAGKVTSSLGAMARNAGANTFASGGVAGKLGGAATYGVGAALGMLGGTARAAGGMTKIASGVAKQQAGKAGEFGNTAAKFLGGKGASAIKGAVNSKLGKAAGNMIGDAAKSLDKATGSKGATMMRSAGGKLAAAAAKQGDNGLRDFGKWMNQTGAKAGGERPNKQAKPATGRM